MLFDGFRRLDPGVLSEHVYVRFEVSRLSSASVVWLNDRWLIQLGLDPMDLATRQGFIDELLSSFAVQSIDQLKADGHCRPADGFLNADRYGGTDGTIHGGSGRCGSKHGYIAKGIGRTPLVSTLADPGHSNGFLSLS